MSEIPWWRWPRLRIWSLSIPLVGTIIRPGHHGFADLATLQRRDYMCVRGLPFGLALVRDRGRGLEL